MVYGLPTSRQDRLQSLLSTYGSLTQFTPGPQDSNYVIVSFDDPAVGLRLERQSGELRLDGWYLGVRKASKDVLPDRWGGASNHHHDTLALRSQPQRPSQHMSSNSQMDGLLTRSNEPLSSSTQLAQHDSHHSSTSPNPSDPFSSISTLTPVKSTTGSVFRPAPQAANTHHQSSIPASYSFGTVVPGQPGHQGVPKSGSGLFGRLSDVMVS